MNNSNTSKIIQTVLIIAALCIVVAVATRIRQKKELTLASYADQNPTLAYAAPADSAESDTSGDESAGGEAGNESSDVSSNEEIADAFTRLDSSLVGAGLQDLDSDMLLAGKVMYSPDPDGKCFYYEAIGEHLLSYITGSSYPAEETSVISPEELVYVHVLHYNFDGNIVAGELICNRELAVDMVQIFHELYKNEYRIEKLLLIDEYGGDDHASMLDNNTSCFNYREVEGSGTLSKHALGRAIDINPFYNPYITYNSDGSMIISPEGSEPYVDRTADFPYKIDENDLCYKLFTEHGFTWGGNWNSCKDYQHFQKVK